MNFIYDMKDLSGIFTMSAIFNVLKAAIILIFGWWAIKRLCKFVPVLFNKSCPDLGMVSFLESLLRGVLRTLLIVIVLGCLGLDITAILTTIGASVVAIGISVKDSISNLFSGVILVMTKPIHVGDHIECEGFSGKVLKIETMFTILQTKEENCTIIIPNNKLISSIIKRKSDFDISKVEYSFEVSYLPKSSDLDRFFQKEFILNKNILQMPLPKISIESVENGVSKIKVAVWCENKNVQDVKSSLEDVSKKLTKNRK